MLNTCQHNWQYFEVGKNWGHVCILYDKLIEVEGPVFLTESQDNPVSVALTSFTEYPFYTRDLMTQPSGQQLESHVLYLWTQFPFIDPMWFCVITIRGAKDYFQPDPF